jgi:hypothetical protein
MPNRRTQTAPIDFRESLDRAVDLIETKPDSFPLAAWAESSLCASLAVWEAVTLGNSKSAQWRIIWSEACRRLHPDTEGLTLAELPGSEPCSWRRDFTTSNDIGKAYRRVRLRMREVYQSTLAHFTANAESVPDSRRAIKVARVLIDAALTADDAPHGPAGQEAYLLRFIQWLECFLSCGKSQSYAWGAWREKIRHTRLHGPASSKTLAVGLPIETRLKRTKATPLLDHSRSLDQLAVGMRTVIAAFDQYVSSRSNSAEKTGSLK